MDKNGLDCKKMPIHPYSPDFKGWIKANIPTLYERKFSIDSLSVFRYIYLMYHQESPIQELVNMDWFARKFEAAEAANLPSTTTKKGLHFKMEVEKALLGKDNDFNDGIIDFISWYNNPVWTEMIFHQETLMKLIKEALGGGTGDKNSTKLVADIYDRLTILQKKLLSGGDDSEELIRRIYYRVEESRLKIKPEEYAQRLINGDRLEEDTPYGVYKSTPKLRFIGTKIPRNE